MHDFYQGPKAEGREQQDRARVGLGQSCSVDLTKGAPELGQSFRVVSNGGMRPGLCILLSRLLVLEGRLDCLAGPHRQRGGSLQSGAVPREGLR